MKELSRRQCFKLAGAYALSHLGLLTYANIKGQIEHRNEDQSAVTEQKRNSKNLYVPLEIKTEIGENKVHMLGVAHTREFAQDYYPKLEELVAQSSAVVMETFIGEGAYKATIYELCKKHKKKIILPDSLSLTAFGTEALQRIAATSAGIYYLANQSRNLSEKERWQSIGKTILFGYLGFGLFIDVFATIGTEGFLEPQDASIKANKYQFNHIVDQRNVELTNRLLDLPKFDGELLVNFGRAHIVGLNYYLKHPIVRRIKSFMYDLTYDLVDSNKIAVHEYIGGKWREAVLSY